MGDYSKERDEVLMHIAQDEWETAREKIFAVLQNEPENIEFIALLVLISSLRDFYHQDVIDYGEKALLWAKNNACDITEFNSLKLSLIDIRDYMARAYFSLNDFSAADNELSKIRESLGRLPDNIMEFALKNEFHLNGIDACLNLAEQLADDFEDRESDYFDSFKQIESMVCFQKITAMANGLVFPESMPLEKAQEMAIWLLRMVNSLEDVDKRFWDENSESTYTFGKEWLLRVLVVLYRGESTGTPEMKTNNHYSAAKECIMVLEKLADMGNGSAQGMLGEIYSSAYNVEQDEARAFNYFKQAYENGEKTALIHLALYYDEGEVTEKDSKKALEYAKKAVEAGIKRADTVLGQIYADSMGDVEQGVVWLKRGYFNGDEIAKNILLRLARENIDKFDDKLEFILDTNEKLEIDIEALGTGYVTDLGRKYAKYYMEIEKYYVSPLERLRFINVCLNVQVDLVTGPGGIVSGDYFIDQFEKLIVENYELASKIAGERQIASRISDLAFVEIADAGATGEVFDNDDLHWGKIMNYYFPRALELGWDGYYADGSGPWKPCSSGEPGESVSSESGENSADYNETVMAQRPPVSPDRTDVGTPQGNAPVAGQGFPMGSGPNPMPDFGGQTSDRSTTPKIFLSGLLIALAVLLIVTVTIIVTLKTQDDREQAAEEARIVQQEEGEEQKAEEERLKAEEEDRLQKEKEEEQKRQHKEMDIANIEYAVECYLQAYISDINEGRYRALYSAVEYGSNLEKIQKKFLENSNLCENLINYEIISCDEIDDNTYHVTTIEDYDVYSYESETDYHIQQKCVYKVSRQSNDSWSLSDYAENVKQLDKYVY